MFHATVSAFPVSFVPWNVLSDSVTFFREMRNPRRALAWCLVPWLLAPGRPTSVASVASVASASKRQALLARHVLAWDQLLARLERGQIRCLLVLCGARPGNLGAVLRSSTLLGVSAVCVLGEPSRAELDRALRFSMVEQKSHWDTLVVPVPSNSTLLELKQRGMTLVGLVADDCDSIRDVDLSGKKLGLVFGADEEDGQAFPDGVAEHIDMLACIPMKSFGVGTSNPDTLNLSAAAAIVAYEWHCQQKQPWWCQLLPKWRKGPTYATSDDRLFFTGKHIRTHCLNQA